MSLLSPIEALRRPPPDWLIQGILPGNALTMVYGASDTYKTFVVLDMAASIATGRSWHGHAARWGFVVYIVAEGGEGFPTRVAAWAKAHRARLDTLPLFQRLDPVQLLEDGEVDELLDRVERLHAELPSRPVLVVFDTLGMCLQGGDENSNSDIHRVVLALNRIRRATNATLLVVHHTSDPKAKRPRGASAMRGDLNTLILVSRQGTTLTLTCEKQKDAPRFQPISLQVAEVPLTLPGGTRATSLVVVDAGKHGRQDTADQEHPGRDDQPTKASRRRSRVTWEAVLDALIRQPGATPKTLAQELGGTRKAVWGHLNRLVHKRLASQPQPGQYVATPDGRQLRGVA